MAVFAFIEGFDNRTRRHSALGYLPPIEYEARAMAENNSSLPANRPRKRGNFNFTHGDQAWGMGPEGLEPPTKPL